MNLLDWLFSPSGLTPHGFCLTWAPGLLWLHAGSDAITGLAYFSIPLALARFVIRRRDLQYHWLAYLFGAFILACGLTHFMAIYTLWVPAYGVEGLVKLATALLSIATASILWPLVPRLVALPSPSQMHELNGKLQATIDEQSRTAALLRDSEARMRAMNVDLERRVAERTADLSATNERLTRVLAERSAAESALRDGEARMRLAFAAAKLGVWEMDFANNVGRLDARAAVMTAKDLPAETWLPLDGPELAGFISRIHPDDLPARAEAVNAIRVGTTDMVQMEYRVRREDGEDWTWLTHWRAVIDRDPATGKPTRAVGVILDTTERAEVEASLRDAVSQRDLLLREVYHRVKNNLQIVDGLLMLKSRSLDDPKAIEALASLRSRIYALGLVHSQLMASKNLETFDIAPFLLELAQNIVAGVGRSVSVEVEACPLEVGLDFAVPLGLLVTELITNSLKHAFPDGVGTIRIGLDRDGVGDVILTVADDGPGEAPSPAAVLAKPGVGASIISGLVKQLSGIISVQDDAGRTTTVTIPATEFA